MNRLSRVRGAVGKIASAIPGDREIAVAVPLGVLDALTVIAETQLQIKHPSRPSKLSLYDMMELRDQAIVFLQEDADEDANR